MEWPQLLIPLHSLGDVVDKSGVKSKVQPGKMRGYFGAFWSCSSTQLYFNWQQIKFSKVESFLPMTVIGKRTLWPMSFSIPFSLLGRGKWVSSWVGIWQLPKVNHSLTAASELPELQCIPCWLWYLTTEEKAAYCLKLPMRIWLWYNIQHLWAREASAAECQTWKESSSETCQISKRDGSCQTLSQRHCSKEAVPSTQSERYKVKICCCPCASVLKNAATKKKLFL